MPSSAIRRLFKEGKLHSGKNGPVVTDTKQAEAIKLSYLRKEGKLKDRARRGR